MQAGHGGMDHLVLRTFIDAVFRAPEAPPLPASADADQRDGGV